MATVRFKDKVVLVTGGAFGIGKNIALAFRQEGARVFVVDIDTKAGARLTQQYPGITFIKMDLASPLAPKKTIAAVIKKAGRIDVLINNASLGIKKSLLEESVEDWEKAVEINLRAPYFLSQAAITVMKKLGCGVIVNIASVASQLTCHQAGSYHAAKAGIVQMTRYLAAFAGPWGIRVNSVAPGFIVRDEDRKRFHRNDNESYRRTAYFCHPLGIVGAADDVASAVLFFASQQARFITGQNLVVDGGLTLQEPSGLVFHFSKEQKKKNI